MIRDVRWRGARWAALRRPARLVSWGFEAALDRSLGALLALQILGMFVSWGTLVVPAWDVTTGPVRVGLVAAAACCVVLGVAVVRRRPGAGVATATVLVAVLVFVVLAPRSGVTTDPGAAILPLVTAAVVVTMARLPSRIAPAALRGVIVVVALLPGFDRIMALFVLATVIGTAAGGGFLRDSAVRADDAEARLLATNLRAARASARTRSQDEVRSLLHDEAVVALRVIREGFATPTEVREAAAGAVRALLDAAELEPGVGVPVDLVPRLRTLRAGPVPVVVQLPDRLEVPDRVADALVGAAAEALRNVARHARARTTTLTVRCTPGGVEVLIRDDGVGAVDRPVRLLADEELSGPDPDLALRTAGSDPGPGPAGAARAAVAPNLVVGDGLRRSVAGRLAAVDGTATIEPAPGGGTGVRLTWDRSQHPRPVPPVDHDARLVAAAGRTTVPFVLACGIVGVRRHLVGQAPGWPLICVAGLLVALALVLWRAQRSGFTAVLVGTAIWSGVGAIAFDLAVARDGDPVTTSWAFGAIGPVLATIAVLGRWRSGAVLIGVHGVALAVVVLHAGHPLGVWVSPMMSILLPWLFAILARSAMLAFTRSAAAAGEAEGAVLADQAARAERAEVYAVRMQVLLSSVLPFLADVVAGASVDEVLVARAAALEHECRDELRAPQLLDDDVRAALRTLRAAGAAVRLQGSQIDADLGPVRAALARAAHALAPVADRLDVVVTLSSATEDGTALSVVAVGGVPDQVATALRATGFAAQDLAGAVLASISPRS